MRTVLAGTARTAISRWRTRSVFARAVPAASVRIENERIPVSMDADGRGGDGAGEDSDIEMEDA